MYWGERRVHGREEDKKCGKWLDQSANVVLFAPLPLIAARPPCRVKRMQRLKAFADGQRKIRYECRKVLADARPRFKGRFAKEVLTGGMAGSGPSGAGGMRWAGAGGFTHPWDPSGRNLAASVRSFGSGLDSETAAQLRRAMSAINLEAVAKALAQSKQKQLQRERGSAGGTLRGGAAAADQITDLELEELMGADKVSNGEGPGGGRHGERAGTGGPGVMGGPNEVQHCDSSLPHQLSQATERPSASANNSGGGSETVTLTSGDISGDSQQRGGGGAHRPSWPLQQQHSISSAFEGALGHNGGSLHGGAGGPHGHSLHGGAGGPHGSLHGGAAGAQGLFEAILSDAYQP